ncbi:MAG TPA: aminopeptidase [Pseudomonadales bacterium]
MFYVQAIRRALKRHALIIVAVLLVGGCNTLGYYRQAISGQLYILSNREAIDAMLARPDLDPDLRGRLEQVTAVRRFAAAELDLPASSMYSTYVALDRPYVVWNVFAAPEFSMRPRSWCYPIAGCVSYRGYFNEADAVGFAEALRSEGGLDVYIGGVSAYSTLGWFSDPVLSTIIRRQDHQLAALIFHELAHQVAYAPGDTEFNESFATAVEREGQRRWLQARANASERAEVEERIAQELQRQEEFVALVQQTVADLEKLYQSGMEPDAMRLAKSTRLDKLGADYAALKEQWDGYSGYDAWFAGGVNNAQLATVNTYNKLVLSFTALLDSVDGHLPTFYARVQELQKLSHDERHAELRALLD